MGIAITTATIREIAGLFVYPSTQTVGHPNPTTPTVLFVSSFTPQSFSGFVFGAKQKGKLSDVGYLLMFKPRVGGRRPWGIGIHYYDGGTQDYFVHAHIAEPKDKNTDTIFKWANDLYAGAKYSNILGGDPDYEHIKLPGWGE